MLSQTTIPNPFTPETDAATLLSRVGIASPSDVAAAMATLAAAGATEFSVPFLTPLADDAKGGKSEKEGEEEEEDGDFEEEDGEDDEDEFEEDDEFEDDEDEFFDDEDDDDEFGDDADDEEGEDEDF